MPFIHKGFSLPKKLGIMKILSSIIHLFDVIQFFSLTKRSVCQHKGRPVQKRILMISKISVLTICCTLYLWTSSGAPTYTVPGLFKLS